MPTSSAAGLPSLLNAWWSLLQGSAASGRFIAAAVDALQLSAATPDLEQLSAQLAAADWSDLPPVALLDAASLGGARGAYANGTIYLNTSWWVAADQQAVLAVLTEELGHHLDQRLNASDTPGDEGELFAALLLGEAPSAEQRAALQQQNDWGAVVRNGVPLVAEQAGPEPQLQSTPIPAASPGRTRFEFRNAQAFAAIRDDGSVVSWGDPGAGGDSSGVDFDGVANNLGVVQIFSNLAAFAALRTDGSVVTWGDPFFGGDSRRVDFNGPNNNLTVTRIFSTGFDFAALRSDGSVVSWGDPLAGGNSNGVDFNGPNNNLTVSQIVSGAYAFAALRSDGSVVTWGDALAGGNSTGVDFNGPSNTLTVSQIFATSFAFAALRSDGSVVTWGDSFAGGDSSTVDFNGPDDTLSVSQIFSTNDAFAALRSDGSVVSWGGESTGGDSSGVDFAGPDGNLKVTGIVSTDFAFAAVRNDGSVVSWGDASAGGDSSGVDFDGPNNNLTVSSIAATLRAFAALRSDGSVVSWGDASAGGDSSGVDVNGPNNSLSVTSLSATLGAFAALRSDGSLITWGDPLAGGDSSGVDVDGPGNNLTISRLYTNSYAFAALRSDGSVVSWGDPAWGGDSSSVDFNGPNHRIKVLSLADPFSDDRLIPPPEPRVAVGVSNLTLTTPPPGGLFYAAASLSQEADNRPMRSTGVESSNLDMGGPSTVSNTTVQVNAAVTTRGAYSSAIGIDNSALQLRPGDDVVTVEAAISGSSSAADSSVAVRDSLISGNRGNDTITLRGQYWGDRALIFGGAGNDRITGYGIGLDSFIQAGDGDDVVSLGLLETTPGAAPLQRAKGAPVRASTYRGGNGFDVLQLRDITQAAFLAEATPFSEANEIGVQFRGARFSGFEQILFG